jgi:hypothetical protein
VEDAVDRLFDLDVLHHVVVDEREAVIADVLEIDERARLEVVYADHAVPLREQEVAEMGTEEAGPAGYDRSGHERRRIAMASEGLVDSYEAFTVATFPFIKRIIEPMRWPTRMAS